MNDTLNIHKIEDLIIGVTGGRDYKNYIQVNKELSLFTKPKFILAGGARGLDSLVETWCDFNGVYCVTVNALWTSFGKPAGPKRNEWMLKTFNPDILLVFPGGSGTADCKAKALELGIPVIDIYD